MSPTPSFALIGPGRVGLAITRRLLEAGYRLQALVAADAAGREVAGRWLGQLPAGAELTACAAADLVLLAVPDDRIGAVAADLQQAIGPQPQQLRLHFSGLHPAALLGPGAANLSLHPLMTFPSAVAGYAALPGCPWAVEGDEEALERGERLVTELEGRAFRLAAEQKTLYHAAATVTSNYAVALAAAGRDLLAACGPTASEAWDLLSPLLQQTWANLSRLMPEEALTGPIARGDVATVASHLAILPADRQPLYRSLGREALALARRRGLPPATATALEQLLRD